MWWEGEGVGEVRTWGDYRKREGFGERCYGLQDIGCLQQVNQSAKAIVTGEVVKMGWMCCTGRSST